MFKLEKVSIKEKEVLRLLGYRGREATGEVKRILTRENEEGEQLLNPQVLYSRKKVKGQGDGVIALSGGLVLNIGSTALEWKGSEYLWVVICTIGTALENRVDELFAQGDFPTALVLDTVGSVAMEGIANETNYFICRQERSKGNRVGARASPGYGKWSLADQRVLFSLLPAHKIGIELNQQCMMIPRKSVSFCLGVGKGLDFILSPCRRCGKEGCEYRQT